MMPSERERGRIRPSPSVVAYVAIHVGALGVFFVPGRLATGVAILIGTYYLRIVGLSAYHRYFAHRSYKTSRAMQVVLAVLGMTALQKGPLWWAETHRRHHRSADTEDDIHSPTYQGFWYSHWGWFFDRRYERTDYGAIKDFAVYPELVWLDGVWPCRAVILAYAVALWLLFGMQGIVWGFCLSTVLSWHTVHWVQSVSHKWGGYRNFETADQSRNHWLFAVISMGEFHNNHHHRPSSARFGYRWWEIDATYYLLKVLGAVHLVWDVRDRLNEVPVDDGIGRWASSGPQEVSRQ